MSRLIVFFIFSLTFIFCGCNLNSKKELTYMSFDNIKYIDTFPHSFSPNGDKQVIDVIGVRNFLIYDSIMIMSTINKDSLWVIASMPDFQIKGSMLKIGQGPNELTVPPSVAYNTKITEVNNKLFAYIYEPYKGE